MAKFAFMLFLCFLSLFSVQCAPKKTKDGFDIYKYALQWPKTATRQREPNRPNITVPAMFTIHGLWPLNTKGGKSKENNFRMPIKYPNGTILGWPVTFVDELKMRWRDFVNDNDFGFWTHEWRDHGRFQDKDAGDYFGFGINLHKANQISRLVPALGNAKSPILIGHSYDLKTLEAAFKETIGKGNFDVPIKCKGTEVLEFYIFIDPVTKAQVQPLGKSECGHTNITLPSP